MDSSLAYEVWVVDFAGPGISQRWNIAGEVPYGANFSEEKMALFIFTVRSSAVSC